MYIFCVYFRVRKEWEGPLVSNTNTGREREKETGLAKGYALLVLHMTGPAGMRREGGACVPCCRRRVNNERSVKGGKACPAAGPPLCLFPFPSLGMSLFRGRAPCVRSHARGFFTPSCLAILSNDVRGVLSRAPFGGVVGRQGPRRRGHMWQPMPSHTVSS